MATQHIATPTLFLCFEVCQALARLVLPKQYNFTCSVGSACSSLKVKFMHFVICGEESGILRLIVMAVARYKWNVVMHLDILTNHF